MSNHFKARKAGMGIVVKILQFKIRTLRYTSLNMNVTIHDTIHATYKHINFLVCFTKKIIKLVCEINIVEKINIINKKKVVFLLVWSIFFINIYSLGIQ